MLYTYIWKYAYKNKFSYMVLCDKQHTDTRTMVIENLSGADFT